MMTLISNASSTYPRNMVNFDALTAEIGSGVWCTRKFQRVSRLGSVTARHSTDSLLICGAHFACVENWASSNQDSLCFLWHRTPVSLLR